MTIYYVFILLLLLLFQQEKEQMVLNVLVLSLVATEYTMSVITSILGVGFFDSMMIIELTSLLILYLPYKMHKCRLIFIPFFLSFVINMFFHDVYNTPIYSLIQPYYDEINLVLYEVILLICIKNSQVPEILNIFCDKVSRYVDDIFSAIKTVVSYSSLKRYSHDKHS